MFDRTHEHLPTDVGNRERQCCVEPTGSPGLEHIADIMRRVIALRGWEDRLPEGLLDGGVSGLSKGIAIEEGSGNIDAATWEHRIETGGESSVRKLDDSPARAGRRKGPIMTANATSANRGEPPGGLHSMLRAWARGHLPTQAAVNLLVDHGTWPERLFRAGEI